MSNQVDDFTDLVPPDRLPELADAELARSLPLAVLARAIGAETEYLNEFLANPINGYILPELERFQRWSDANVAVDGLDPWLRYLAESRALILKNLWDAHDPKHQIDNAVRDLVGDEALGTSLWFSYLADVGVISREDESRWCHLWGWNIANDLRCDIAEGAFDDV